MVSHVLFFANAYPSTINPAAGAFVREQVEALRRQGVKVGVISITPEKLTKAGSPTRLISEFGYPVVNRKFFNLLPYLPYYNQYKVAALYQKAYKDYVAEHGSPQMIHATFGLWAGWGAYSCSREFQIPYVVTEQTTYFYQKKHGSHELGLFRKIYGNAQAVITVSKGLAGEVKKVSNVTSPVVIPNMVNTEFFKPAGGERKGFFALGNLVPQKGLDHLLAAFAIFNKKHPEVVLTIGGMGPLKEDLMAQSKSLGIAEKVVFTGVLDRPQVKEYMEKAIAFTLPSRHETFGVVFIEALAAGTPVLATKCGGPEEFVTGETGVLCEVGNVECLAKGMTHLFENSYLYPPESLHQYASENFSSASVADRIKEVFEKAIEKNNG